MGVLKVKINGVWEEAVPYPTPEPPMDEVWTGQESPDPAGTYELWYDTNTEPGVLKAKRPNGVWEEVGTPDEVWVSPDEPTDTKLELWVDTDDNSAAEDANEVEVTDIEPTTEWELWVDTSSLMPPPGTIALAINDLTDVDTVTTAPVEGDGLGWSDTASNWVPQPVWKSWSGSQQEYDALGTYDNNTLYAII